jgi:predicted nucleic acid-binding protein
MAFPVFFDTCALYGAVLNDLLLSLSERGAFRPLWSRHVLEELEAALSLRIGAEPAKKRVGQMQAAFPDATVRGYEALIENMKCEPKDRHVLAAAVRSDAAVIVTFNLKDFPSDALEPFDIDAVHPDAFLLDQLDLFPEITLGVLNDLADAYENPPVTIDVLLDHLAKDAPNFVHAVRSVL